MNVARKDFLAGSRFTAEMESFPFQRIWKGTRNGKELAFLPQKYGFRPTTASHYWWYVAFSSALQFTSVSEARWLANPETISHFRNAMNVSWIEPDNRWTKYELKEGPL